MVSLDTPHTFCKACGVPASPTEMRLAFAGVPQVPRRCGWRLRESRKSHGDAVGVCGNPASPTEMRLAFAGIPQVPRRCGWRLREFPQRTSGKRMSLYIQLSYMDDIRRESMGTRQVNTRYTKPASCSSTRLTMCVGEMRVRQAQSPRWQDFSPNVEQGRQSRASCIAFAGGTP